MKQKYLHLAARLQQFLSVRSDLSMVSSAAAAMPALHNVGNAFMLLTTMLMDDMMRPLLQDLADLENYTGPRAVWERRDAMSKGPDYAENTDLYIRGNYPATYEPYMKLDELLRNYIPNVDDSNAWESQYGPVTMDVRPVQESLMNLLNTIGSIPVTKVRFHSGDHPGLFLDDWSGFVDAELIIGHKSSATSDNDRFFEVRLTYDNKSVVTANFTMAIKTTGDANTVPMRVWMSGAKMTEAMQLSGAMSNTGLNYQYVDGHGQYHSESTIPLPTKFKFQTDVYNAFENVHYTAGANMIGRKIMDELFREMFASNGVVFDQSADREWLNPKMLYKFLKPIIDSKPYPGVIPLGNETHFDWQLMERAERNYRYNDDNPTEFYKEVDIVDDVKDPTEIKSRRILYAVHIQENHARYAKFNVQFDLDPVAEDCEVKCYDTSRKREFQPTPWMMKWMFWLMVEDREKFLPLEEQRQIEAAALKAQQEERERIRMMNRQDGIDAR